MKQKWFVDHKQIFDYINERVSEGITAKQAIEEYSELEQVPAHRVRTSYYDLKRKQVETHPKEVIKEEVKQEENIIEVVAKLARLSEESKIDVEAVLRSLVPLFEAAISSDKDKKIRALEGQLEELKRDQEVVNERLDEFLKLPSLKKFADLEQFTHDLKIIVDGQGFVQQINRC